MTTLGTHPLDERGPTRQLPRPRAVSVPTAFALAAVVLSGCVAIETTVEDAQGSAQPTDQAGDQCDGGESVDVLSGPIHTDEGRAFIDLVDAETKRWQHRRGEFSITSDRAGVIVPIVGLTDDEARQIAALSSGDLTATARKALLAEDELHRLAQALMAEIGPDDGYARVDTDREVVELVVDESRRSAVESQMEGRAVELVRGILEDRQGPGFPVSNDELAAELAESVVAYTSGYELTDLGGQASGCP